MGLDVLELLARGCVRGAVWARQCQMAEAHRLKLERFARSAGPSGQSVRPKRLT
jgi:hypothetical protein